MFGMDSTTKVILLNCFGGMQDTLKISALLVDAVSRDLVSGKPVVVRMAGTSSV
jgi:succinyl-CoA synthetase beta subunit